MVQRSHPVSIAGTESLSGLGRVGSEAFGAAFKPTHSSFFIAKSWFRQGWAGCAV